MKNLSSETQKLVDEKISLISDYESQLIYAARYNRKVGINFLDMMSETHKLLAITKPLKKYPNANTHQNLY